MGIKIYTMVVGPVQTNCYLLANEATMEAICVDPGARADAIIDKVSKEGFTLSAILLTHGHFDHITAARQVADSFHVKIYANEKERNLMASPDLNLSLTMMGEATTLVADEWLTDGQEITLAGYTIKAISTPGHTEGGMCYYLPEAELLISGDTLFHRSMGRTDFPTGSYVTLVASIKEKLFMLPDSTRVLPGHDMDTMIGYEKEEFLL